MPELRVGERRLVLLEDLKSEAATVWRELSPGSIVWLSGDLGTGKTSFVQALARAAGTGPARSPSYALVHEYLTPEGPLVHADCYRLRSPDEALDLDFPELSRRARLLVIEWPENAGRHAPAPDLHLAFTHTDDPTRRLLERLP